MITSLVEPGGPRPGDETRRAVIVTMLAFTALAALIGGAASPGAGLAIIALGLIFTIAIDMRLWREVMSHHRASASREAPRAELPPPAPAAALPASVRSPARVTTATTTRLPVLARIAGPDPLAKAGTPVLETSSREPEPEPEVAPAPPPAPPVKPAPKPRRKPARPKQE